MKMKALNVIKLILLLTATCQLWALHEGIIINQSAHPVDVIVDYDDMQSPVLQMAHGQKERIQFTGMITKLSVNGYNIDVYAAADDYCFIIADDGVYWDSNNVCYSAGYNITDLLFKKKRCLW